MATRVRGASSSLPPANTRRQNNNTTALPVRQRSQQRLNADRSVRPRTLAAPAVVVGVQPAATRRSQSSDTDSHAGDGPWKHQSPTQVGSGRLVCRYRLTGAQLTTRAPKKFGVRLLEPFEQMRCIGWSDSMWRHARDSWSTYDKLELIPEMAGNAFCIFHYLPVCCALFSTWGRFMPSSVDGDDANDAEGV